MEKPSLLGESFTPLKTTPFLHREVLEQSATELVLVELPADIEPHALKKRKICMMDGVVSPVSLEGEYECEVTEREEGIPRAMVLFPDEEGSFRPVRRISAYVKVVRSQQSQGGSREKVIRTLPREPRKNLKLKWQHIEPLAK